MLRDPLPANPGPDALQAAVAPDAEDLAPLIDALADLRAAAAAQQRALAPWLAQVAPHHHDGAVNLAHYLALRQHDLRDLQARLTALGLSSLGRAEPHVMASLDRVQTLLCRLAGHPAPAPLPEGSPGPGIGGAGPLAERATALFGPATEGRDVRIMVTLPSTAADDPRLAQALVDAGMDVARINCAHDGPADWRAMATHVRQAAQTRGRGVRILMDLGGPKLRTGPMSPSPAVLKLKPSRDTLGRITAPSRLWLWPGTEGHPAPPAADGPGVAVDPAWLAAVHPGDHLHLVDARDALRQLEVTARDGQRVAVQGRRTAYLTDGTRLMRAGIDGAPQVTTLSGLPRADARLHLQRGDTLWLVGDGLGRGPIPAQGRRRAQPARVVCTLPEALDALQPGQAVWFDDGRLGAVARRRQGRAVLLEVTHARDGGEALAPDKGINLPDTVLALPALTAKDLVDLDTVAEIADLVGLSFAQSADDVRALQSALQARGAGDRGIVLKVETRQGFQQLPEMLFAAMTGPAAAVMIARGDLAVECGYERLAEVQEEILWACEAAHLPVVWATQVLETLARTGRPSRAEITDAAMGERAECVMLNKGPHVLEAIRTLDDILRRMQAHQAKKRPLMRALKSWRSPAPPVPWPTDAASAEAQPADGSARSPTRVVGSDPA